MNKRNIKSVSSLLAAVAVITGSVVIMSGKKAIDKNTIDYTSIEAPNNAFIPIVKDENINDPFLSNELSGKINDSDIKFETVKDEIWHKMLIIK